MTANGDDTGATRKLRYTSFSALRKAHRDLLERHHEGGSADLEEAIHEFIIEARATGSVLDDDEDRWAAQSLLNYWVTVLDRFEREAPSATLAEFDPDLAPELDDELCPYLGLDSFQPRHNHLFFGRARVLSHLLQRVAGERLLALVGPSGSGKSSLVLGGLLPALQRGEVEGSEGWRYPRPVVPGAHPLSNLAASVSSLTSGEIEPRTLTRNPRELANRLGGPNESPVVLIIDQLEEIFTLCDDYEERHAFVDSVLELTKVPRPRHVVILTLRTDFESYVGRLPQLQPLFSRASELVTPLSAGELREAIVEPAEMVGLKFEEGVVDALLHETVGEPAALPLLQFTLLKLWENRERNRVTWAAYQRLGGGRRALARAADEFWNELAPEEQVTARRILTSLVRWRTGLELYRARVSRAELHARGEAAYRVDHVLEKLVNARLVRLTPGESPTEDRIEVAHEALVRNWPRFVDWIDEEREERRQRLKLHEAAKEWDDLGRSSALLLRGAKLDDALEYRNLEGLNAEFVQASVAYRRGIQRRRTLSKWGAGIALVVLASAILWALWKDWKATQERESAARERRRTEIASLVAERATVMAAYEDTAHQDALRQRDRARAEAIAADAQARRARLAEGRATVQAVTAASMNNLEVDPELSLLLALRAVEMSLPAGNQEGMQGGNRPGDRTVTPNARDALSRALQRSRVRHTVSGHSHALWDVAFDPAGRRIVTATGGGTATVRDLETDRTIRLEGHDRAIYSVAFSPDGNTIATGSRDRTTILWDAGSGRLLHRLTGHRNTIAATAFSPGSDRLATAGADGTVRLWDVSSGDSLLALSVDDDGWVWSVDFSPDGQLLATASSDGVIRIYDVGSSTPRDSLLAHAGQAHAARFGPEPGGRRIVSAGSDGYVYLWDRSSGQGPLVIAGPGASALDALFTPDGSHIAAVRSDGSAAIWNVESLDSLPLTGHSGLVFGLAAGPGGERLATAGTDGTVRLWSVRSGDQLGDPISGEPAGVASVAWSPDGRRLVTASRNGRAKVWDAASGGELLTIGGHIEEVSSVTFADEGDLIVTGSLDGTVRAWSAQSGDSVGAWSPLSGGAVYSLAVGDDGRLAAGGEDSTAIWNRETETEGLIGTGRSRVRGLAFSPDGRLLATAGDSARVWELGRDSLSARTLSGHIGDVTAVDFSPDGRRIATASWDKTAKIWNTTDDDPPTTLSGHAGPVLRVTFSPDGLRVATASLDGEVKLWDPTTGEELLTLTGHSGPIYGLAFDPEGGRLATASWDGTARIWSVVPEPGLQALHRHTDHVYGVDFHPDGTHIVTGGRDQLAYVWETESGQPVAELAVGAGTVFDVVFGGVSRAPLVATGHGDGSARLWEPFAQSSDPLTPIREFTRHWGAVHAVALSPDATRLVTGSYDNTAIIWDAATGDSLHTLEHADRVLSAAFDRRGERLITGSDDDFAKIWDVRTGEASATLPHEGPVWAVAFSPVDTLIATGTQTGVARLWDAATGKLTRTIEPRHGFIIGGLAFDGAGRRLATASWDKTVRVWDIRTGELIFSQAYPSAVADVAVSPDGRRLVTAAHDGVVRVHDLDADMLAQARARATRELTPAECQVFLREDSCPETAVSVVLEAKRAAARGETERASTLFLQAVGFDRSSRSNREARLTDLIALGDELARLGNVDAATAAFEAGNRLAARPELDAEERARSIARSAALTEKLTRGRRLLLAEEVEAAGTSFRAAMGIDAPWRRGPEASLAAETSQALARRSTHEDRIEDAATAMKLALDLDSSVVGADELNTLCWFGTLRQHARRVIEYCELAVSKSPEAGYIRDSRGLARAVLGRLRQAEPDFRYFVEWTGDPRDRRQREDWVRALAAGRNPIDEDVLEALLRFEHGGQLLSEGEFTRAIRAYREAIELDSTFVLAFVRLGTAYFRADSADAGLEAYRTANRLAIADRRESIDPIAVYRGTVTNDGLEDQPASFEVHFDRYEPAPSGVMLIGEPLYGSGTFNAAWKGDSLILWSAAATGDTIRWAAQPGGSDLSGTYSIGGGDASGQSGAWSTRLAEGTGLLEHTAAANPAPEDSPAPVEGSWTGRWSGNGYVYTCTLHIEVGAGGAAAGSIRWRLEQTPGPSLRDRIGLEATEYVAGEYDSEKKELRLTGYGRDDPHGVIGLDRYRLRLSEEGHALQGRTWNHGPWDAEFSARRPRP